MNEVDDDGVTIPPPPPRVPPLYLHVFVVVRGALRAEHEHAADEARQVIHRAGGRAGALSAV